MHVLVAGANAADAAQAAAPDRRRRQGAARRQRRSLAEDLAENVAAQVLAHRQELQPHPVPGHRQRQERRAARGRQARRRRRSPTSPRSISADTFERPIYAGNAIATVQSSDAIKVITVRTTGFDPAAATGGSAAVETAAARGRQRQVELRRPRDHQERPPRADRRQDHRLGRPRAGLRARSSTKC